MAFLHGRRKGRYEFDDHELRGISETTFKLPEVAESRTEGAKNDGTGKAIGSGSEANCEGAEGARHNDEGVGIDAKIGTGKGGGLTNGGGLDGFTNGNGHVESCGLNNVNGYGGGLDCFANGDGHAEGGGLANGDGDGDGHVLLS